MAVAEIFLSAFITVLFEKLASGDLIRLARYAGIYSELNKWNDTLTQIRAVLLDAGRKHIRDESVQTWLNKLQHLAYAIDNVLDDLATEAMRRRLNQESSHASSTSKLLKTIPDQFHALKYGRKMTRKLEAITKELRELVERIQILGLIRNVERSNKESKRPEQTSLFDESEIVGRKGDKEVLLEKLLANESSSRNVSVVSIVGMGGIGKTTLAQVLYNDQKVKDQFELKSWVCVSDDFDVFNISKAIYKDVGGDDKKFETLNQVQVALSEKLSKKRFLLVLDDVWSENYTDWDLLQRPFAVGASGSKVLVTTRKGTVASVMDSVQAYPLEILSNEEAISLFAEHALGKQNFDSHPLLKTLGEGIVKKCGGLPLALKTLGRVLRTKSSSEEWEELLNSEIWNLQSQILPALKLSYYDLPPHLKQMFAYCCLFPKDYMFDKNELVLLWMAEGFLYESNRNRSLESLGQECFEELVLRSFFQHSTNNKSLYTMHDLINDLAMSVAGEFFIMLGDKMDAFDSNGDLEKCHHVSFIHEAYGKYRKFKSLERARHLRTFFPVPGLQERGIFFLSNTVLVKLLPQLQFLRVLNLSNYRIKEIPKSIGSLKHLRYLNFSNTDITCLPEQVGELYNLQSLLLSGCHKLSSLPNSLAKLINLRHLDISDTPKLHKMPLGIGGLTGLQTLSKVIIGGADEFKISDLKGLLHLQGQLSIQGLEKVKDVVQTKEANLRQKEGLRDLEMEWSDVFDDSRNEIREYEVLEGLSPCEKLTSLKILYYKGTKFPSWVGDPSFDCLTHLKLRGCTGCTCLPALERLSSLKKLVVKGMNGLKRVGSESLGPTNSCYGVAFRSLEVLKFEDMQGWEEWSSSGGNKDGTGVSFPCLNKISLINCPKLDVVEIDLIPSLRDCHIERCSEAVLTSMVSVSSSIISLTLRKITGFARLRGDLLEHLRALENLSVSECDDLTYLWESEVEAYEILVSLQKMKVEKCRNLVSLGEKKEDTVISMESLREVEITGCPRFESYNCPNHVEKLNISECGSIGSLTFPTVHEHDHLPSTLKSLGIKDCDNVEMSWLLNNLYLSALESLIIWEMPNMRLFPEGCFAHLTHLHIYNCENIESVPGNGFVCLRVLSICNCKNLKSFAHEHLRSLTSLEYMVIRHCPSMDESFPCRKWPPNLRRLIIGGLKKPISEWGMQQNFPTSLVHLTLFGFGSGVVTFAKTEEEDRRNTTTTTCSSSFLLPSSLVNLMLHGEASGVVTFAKTEEEDRRNTTTTTSSSPSSFLLPSSLTSLAIHNFKELESVSKGMQHLTCLQHLNIARCPKLRDLPETLLPSLSSLRVDEPSGEVRKKCSRRKGKYWPIISQIPSLYISPGED